MNKFHQIPTDKYKPISHDKDYLFNLYETISNFLAFNLSPKNNYRNIITKPVKNGDNFDFYSIYPNLVNLEELQNKDRVLIEYWDFLNLINEKVKSFESSKDDNKKDWAKILKLVFEDKNNIIYSNGTDFCIIWGWQFENFGNYKPDLSKPLIEEKTEPIVPHTSFNVATEEVIVKPEVDEIISEINDTEKPIEEVEPVIEEYVDEDVEVLKENKSSFVEFLKWFASHYWWLLIVLGVLIIIVFFVKSLK